MPPLLLHLPLLPVSMSRSYLNSVWMLILLGLLRWLIQQFPISLALLFLFFICFQNVCPFCVCHQAHSRRIWDLGSAGSQWHAIFCAFDHIRCCKTGNLRLFISESSSSSRPPAPSPKVMIAGVLPDKDFARINFDEEEAILHSAGPHSHSSSSATVSSCSSSPTLQSKASATKTTNPSTLVLKGGVMPEGVGENWDAEETPPIPHQSQATVTASSSPSSAILQKITSQPHAAIGGVKPDSNFHNITFDD